MKSASFAVGFQRPATAGRAEQRGQGRPGAPRPAGAQTQRRPRALRGDVGRCPGRCAPQQLPLRSGSRAPSFPSAWEGSSRIRWCFCKRFQTKPSARSCSGSPASFSPQPKSPATAAARPPGSRFLCSLSCCSFSVFFFLSLSLLFASSLHQLPHLGHISPLLLSTLFQGPAPARRHHLPGTASRAGRCRATRVQRAQLSATAGHHCWIRGTEGALATHREKKNNNSPPSTPPKRKNNQKANKNPLQS